MNDVQTNGEPKKIYLIKPQENSASVINDPGTSNTPQYRSLRSCSADVVRIPPRRHASSFDKNGEEMHLSNHKKQRYWNSWEELYIVELWRRYKDELTIINVPLPVYRKMMVAMRTRNMIVTAQDCRRKINTINTRYKQELQRIESTGCKSDWRLFPLVHCVMQPKIKEFDPWQENVIIKKFLEKIPRPVETEVPAAVLNNINPPTSQTRNLSNSSVSSYQPRNSYQNTTHHSSTNISSAVHTDSTTLNNRLSSSQGRFEKPSILPFRNITAEKIEQLRQDNNRLSEQRDADLKCLHMEEQNFRCFETFIRIWTEQKELELQRIQLMSEKNGISIENENNQNMDQHVQETLVVK